MKYKNQINAKYKYRQMLLATVSTMTLGISTLGSSTFAVAAENPTEAQKESTTLEKNIQQTDEIHVKKI